MPPQCDICFDNFDLLHHRPKSLPCGHTICNECMQKPALGRKCPTCFMNLATDPGGLPDNICLIRMIEEASEPPRKLPRWENTKVQQLQRGVSAGKQVVQVLQQAVETLNRRLDSSVAQLYQMEEALKVMQRAAASNVTSMPNHVEEQLETAVRLEDSLRLLTTKCSVVAEGEGGSTWRATMQLGPIDHILRPMLLQLRANGQLVKVNDGPVSARPAANLSPPMLSTLHINEKKDLDIGGRLKVNDILRDGERWQNIRTICNLKGRDSEKLLRVVAPHLEELKILDNAGPIVMEEVKKMASLKKLLVQCDREFVKYPDLPLQLEELRLTYPTKDQLLCVERMPRLRSLQLKYCGPNVSFPPSQRGGLLYLGVNCSVQHKDTMLSLIHAHALTVQELRITCGVNETHLPDFYFPDLSEDLAKCGLQALRRLVLRRGPHSQPCTEVDACLQQRQIVGRFLSPSVNVLCKACQRSVF